MGGYEGQQLPPEWLALYQVGHRMIPAAGPDPVEPVIEAIREAAAPSLPLWCWGLPGAWRSGSRLPAA
jgi:hypothetical protein